VIACVVTSLAVAAPAEAAPTIIDQIAGSGLTYQSATGETYSSIPTDYDGDAFQDVLITYHDQGARLYRNNGDGTFVRVASAAFPMSGASGAIDRHDCADGDANHDGRTDYYCAVGRTGSNHVKNANWDNELWIQQPDGSFSDVGTAWGVGDPYGRGRAALFLDANLDGFDDLYVTNEVPRAGDPDATTLGQNRLFLSTGGTGFTPAPSFGLDLYLGHGRCLQEVDHNGDGAPDILVCSNNAIRLYLNQGGTRFVEATAGACLTKMFQDFDAVDLDGDADLDIVGIGVSRVVYRLNNAGCYGPEVQVLSLPGDGRAIAEGDVDADGDLDLFAVRGVDRGNPNDYLLMNTGNLSFAALQGPAVTGSGDDVEALQVAPGVTRFLVLNGRDSSGGGPPQLLGLVPGDSIPPTQPGTPTGSSTAPGQISLTWAASSDDISSVLTYRLFRDGGTTPIATFTSSSTTSVAYVDSSLAPGSVHTYAVEARDEVGNSSGLGPASEPITVMAGSPSILVDRFDAGLDGWTTRAGLTIDTTVGGASPPSARAQVSNAKGYGIRSLGATYPTLCLSAAINVTAISSPSIALLKMRTAANGFVSRVYLTSARALVFRNDLTGATRAVGGTLPTGVSTLELCTTVGASGTMRAYVNGALRGTWTTGLGTTPLGRVQILDDTAKTFTAMVDDVIVDLTPG
jgi:hypothetical protein